MRLTLFFRSKGSVEEAVLVSLPTSVIQKVVESPNHFAAYSEWVLEHIQGTAEHLKELEKEIKSHTRRKHSLVWNWTE